MKKEDLNKNIYLSEGNFVLKSNEDVGFLVFDLPAQASCPYATDWCKKYCYAKCVQDLFESVLNCRFRNFEESKKDTFVKDMIDTINFNLERKKYKSKKRIYFRFHGAGDIYSKEYLLKIIDITNYFKDNSKLVFQTYTKSLVFFEGINLSDLNIKILYSIVPDTKETDLENAQNIGFPTFIATNTFDDLICKDNEFKCLGDCSKCQACYEKNDFQNIYVEIHGGRVPNKKRINNGSRIEGDSKNYRDHKKTIRK